MEIEKEKERERKGEELTVEIDQGKHTQEMLSGLNCLITVTRCSTKNNNSNRSSFNYNYNNKNNSNAPICEAAGPP